MTRAPANSYRTELVRAARMGAGFDPGTGGKPAAWAAPEPVTITWYQHAVGYAEMKWPHLAPHLRASLADALATVTPLLTQEPAAGRRASRLRAAWYGYAFNAQQRRSRAPDPVTASALAWLARASLPVSQLSATGARAGPARWCPRRRRSARTSRCEAVLAGTNPAEPAQKMNGTSILVERLYTG